MNAGGVERLNPPETVRKLEWLLSRATGYFGLTNYLGSRFVATPGAMTAFSGALKARGLAFIDDGAAAGKGAGPLRASANPRREISSWS